MQIDNTRISYLEELSCLTFTESEKTQLTEGMQKILNSLSLLKNLDTSILDASILDANDNANLFRDDEVQPSFNRELILKNAQFKNEEYFIAPKTVEQ